jgi:hypothetical protein
MFATVKGITTMNKLSDFAHECVIQYSKYDHIDRYKKLNINDLPDFVQEEFASLILSSNYSLSVEATGPDNDLFDQDMLPCLIKLLKNPIDKDNEIDFIQSWKNGIVSYTKIRMQELIDSEIFDYNDSIGLINPNYRHEKEELKSCQNY